MYLPLRIRDEELLRLVRLLLLQRLPLLLLLRRLVKEDDYNLFLLFGSGRSLFRLDLGECPDDEPMALLLLLLLLPERLHLLVMFRSSPIVLLLTLLL